MRRLPRLTRNLGYATLVLVLPLGYQPTETDSSGVSVGVFGGMGQAVSVLRDCSGRTVSEQAVQFSEQAFSFAFSQAKSSGAVAVVGVRGGYFTTDDAHSVDHPDRTVHHEDWYVNPHVAIEGETVGVGFGLITPAISESVNDLGRPDPFDIWEADRSKIPVSCHLRLGPRDEAFLLASVAENTPIYSGGGLVNIGLGYRVADGVRFFTGLTTGFYEQPGVIQQASFDVPSTPIQLQLSARLGEFGDMPESGGSIGIVYAPYAR
ncbi:MAG: hypothetical protein R3E97_16100 [Candidatus Eisenbacteria bacterium]